MKLRQDLEHFFRVYQGRVDNLLQMNLPPSTARAAKTALDEELDLLRTPLMNRLEEEFSRR